MLTTRLWMGSVLILLVVGMLVVDQRVESYPFQLVFQCVVAVGACYELLRLLGNERGVIAPVAYGGILALTLSSWVVAEFDGLSTMEFDNFTWPPAKSNVWSVVAGLVVLIHLAIFVWEMATFREPGRSFERMARTWWVIGYLGLLPVCFAQIRRLYAPQADIGTVALALAIFVPKCCDIGAYFTGRAIGKHPMTPTLSPKKTWEGAIGGLALATLVAIAIDRLGPAAPLRKSWANEIAFGLLVGAAGMLGDLAESLMKRDCQKKDASQVVPGFGGVLDVVDAVIFSAPVSYFILAGTTR